MPTRSTLAAITREAIEQAIAEHDQLGAEAFLEKYGFREARDYLVVRNGRSYASKALIGAARAYVGDGRGPLKPGDFSGGRNTVVKRLAARRGTLACEACGFDFEARYGVLGSGFIEVHHTKSVHLMKPGEKTRLADLVLLCSNCHRIADRQRPPLSKGEISAILIGG